MWNRARRREPFSEWSAAHAEFAQRVADRFAARLEPYDFTPGLSGTPMRVGAYSVLFEGAAEEELWLSFYSAEGLAKVSGTWPDASSEAPAGSADEAIEVFETELDKLLAARLTGDG